MTPRPTAHSMAPNSAQGPRSWAEDLNSYRDVRGTRSLSAVQSRDAVPARCATSKEQQHASPCNTSADEPPYAINQ